MFIFHRDRENKDCLVFFNTRYHTSKEIDISSRCHTFFKRDALQNFAISIGKNLGRSFFLIKLPATLLNNAIATGRGKRGGEGIRYFLSLWKQIV